MSKIIVVSIIIAFTSIFIIEILLRTKKIEYKSKIHNILYFGGVYIPVSALIISYSYRNTDTLLDFIKVVLPLLFIVNILFIFDKFFNEYKYNWLVLPITFFIIFGCYVFASKYMLSTFNTSIVFGSLGGLLGGTFNKKIYNRKKVILSGIFIIIIIIISIFSFSDELFKISKPIRYAIEKVEAEGYKINDEYTISNLDSLSINKSKPMEILIIRRTKDNMNIEQHFILVYYKDSIIDFKVLK